MNSPANTLNALRVAVAALLLTILVSTAATAAVTIDLRSEAAVSGTVVRLSDIAMVSGEGSETLGDRIICPAPTAGAALIIAPESIRRRLLAISGRADFQFSGAASCRVTPGAVSSPSPTPVVATGGRTLRQVLQARVETAVGRPADRIRVQFDDRDAEILAAVDTHYTFRIRASDSGLGIGTNSVGVDLYETDQPQRLFRTSNIRVRVLLLEDVVVSTRDIKPGEILKAEDLQLERREFTSDDLSRCFRDIRGLIGATVRLPMPAGKMIDIGDLTRTLLVQRGAAVTVYFESRGLSIRTVSRALESGELGDVISIQGKEGRGQFYAEVIGSATVRVRTAAAEARALAAPEADSRLATRR